MAPRKKKEQATAETLALIEALTFCSFAQKEIGTPNETHVILRHKTALTFDSVLAVGTMTDFADIETAPHTLKLLTALKKCKAEYSITQTDAKQLIVRSGAFRAVVPCLPLDTMHSTWPDNPVAPINDSIKAGFAVLSPLIAEKGQHVATSALLLQANSMLATDRTLIAEYWHGCDLPPGLVIPKIAVDAIAKAEKKLTYFGFSETTATFWFEDNSWIKTQLHSEAWPDTSMFFNKPYNLVEVPSKLSEAVDTVAVFSDDGLIYFNSKSVASHRDDSIGATHDVPGLSFNGVAPIVGIKRCKLMLGFATHFDLDADDNYIYAEGNRVRAVLSKQR